MNNLIRLPQPERETLFSNTAKRNGMSPAIVEKDFWVCWALDYLFHDCPWAKHVAFKGGTSLSKCFGLIERFSEDIDIILDWRLLGYEKDEPWGDRSRTKQDKFNKEANARTETFLRESFLPKLQADFGNLLTDDFRLYIDEADPQAVCFAYPRIFGETAILPMVRMELGALAAWTPTQDAVVSSYAAQQYPQIFVKSSTNILTVSPERTFWEKATILHKEAFRTNGKLPARYSRHYYDLYCMDKSPVKSAVLADLDLLERVVRFKDRFYPAGSAHYEMAKPGTLFSRRGHGSVPDSVHTGHPAPSDLPPHRAPSTPHCSLWRAVLLRPAAGLRFPRDAAAGIDRLGGYLTLKIILRNVAPAQRVVERVPHNILGDAGLLAGNDLPAHILGDALKGRELDAQLGDIPRQLLLHLMGSELSAGKAAVVGTRSLTIERVGPAIQHEIIPAYLAAEDVPTGVQRVQIIRLQHSLYAVGNLLLADGEVSVRHLPRDIGERVAVMNKSSNTRRNYW